MQIIAATRADTGDLAALEIECLRPPWNESTLIEALDDEKYCILVARDEDAILGYALGYNVGAEGELARVAVSGSQRGQGIGENLTRAILQIFAARGVQVVFLELRESNLAAQKLYEKCGFVVSGRRENYYDDGEAATVMRADVGVPVSGS